MLATLITTASFTTGDTIDYSITKIAYDTSSARTSPSTSRARTPTQSTDSNYAPESAVAALESEFAGDEDIEGFLPFLHGAGLRAEPAHATVRADDRRSPASTRSGCGALAASASSTAARPTSARSPATRSS